MESQFQLPINTVIQLNTNQNNKNVTLTTMRYVVNADPKLKTVAPFNGGVFAARKL